MKVRELMSKDFVYLSPDDTVSRFISIIYTKRIHEVPLLENKKLVGIVYDKDMANKRFIDPSKEKLRSIMSMPCHTVSPEQTVEEAAEWIFKTGCEGLPVIENNRLVGVITLYDLITTISKSKEFRQTTAEKIMSIPEVVDTEADIGMVKTLMREKHYEKIPVIDLKGRLAGSVDIFDLTKAITPRERINFFSMSAEMGQAMKISVSTIMNREIVTARKDSSLNEIANLMERGRTSEIIIVEDNYPRGIIAAKDLLEVYMSGFKEKGIYYQIIGLTDEDEFVVSTAERMIEDSLKKLSNIYRLNSFFLHVKKHQEHGDKAKYSIRTRLRTAKGTFVSKSYDWDLRDAVNEALSKLEKIMIKGKITTKDKIKRMRVKYKRMQE